MNGSRQAKLTRGLELAALGRSYEEIARELGYANRSGAWKLLSSALKAHVAEDVEDFRAMAIARLDALLFAAWRRIEQGDLNAINTATRVVMMQARLYGLLDAPEGRSEATRDSIYSA